MFKCASLGVFVVAMFLIGNIAPHVRRVWINPGPKVSERQLQKERYIQANQEYVDLFSDLEEDNKHIQTIYDRQSSQREHLKWQLSISAEYEREYLDEAKECPQCPSMIDSKICAPYYSFERARFCVFFSIFFLVTLKMTF